MTSKISSVKLFRESIKRNSAMGAFLLLIYFCTLPLTTALISRHGSTEYVLQRMEDMKSILAKNPILVCWTLGFAVILGIMQFSYLHSREKLDFYHSIPVRREKFFLVQYLGGVALWLIPYALTLILALGIAGFKGMADGTVWLAAIKGLGVQTVIFLLIYTCMILSMMLTGKIFVAILGMCVICGYIPGLFIVWEGLCTIYLKTYVYNNIMYSGMELSPVYAAIKVFSQFVSPTASARDMVMAFFLISLMLAGLCIYLYRMRESEKAGRTMAFDGIAKAIKLLLVVPASLASQIFFITIGGGSDIWGIFGLLFGFGLSTAIVQFIYTMDIREIFKDRRQMVISFLIVLGITAVFRFDLTGYDEDLPEKSQVESVEMPASRLLDTGAYPESIAVYELYSDEDGGTLYQLDYYKDKERYVTRNLDLIYDLLEKRQEEEITGEDYNRSVIITYNLSDGTKKVRRYYLTRDDLQGTLEKLWEDREYRENVFPMLKIDPERVLDIQVNNEGWIGTLPSDVESVSQQMDDVEEYSSSYIGEISGQISEGQQITLTRDQREKVFETLCEELEEGVNQMEAGNAYQMNVVYLGENGDILGEQLYLNNSKPKTKALLEEYGFKLEGKTPEN